MSGVPDATLSAIGQAAGLMLPEGCTVDSVDVGISNGTTTRTYLLLHRLPATAVPIIIRCTGWGSGLERSEIPIRTGFDPAKRFEDALTEAIEKIGPKVFEQQAMAHAARRVGILQPLSGDDLLRTDHLVVDPDAVATVADLLGSGGEAKAWLLDQIVRRRDKAERPDSVKANKGCLVSVVGTTLKIEFGLNPLSFRRDETATEEDRISHWSDDQAYVAGMVPDTVMLTLPGRRLGEIVAGTPIGHRIIRAAVSDEGDANMPAFIAVELDTPRAPFDDMLGRL